MSLRKVDAEAETLLRALFPLVECDWATVARTTTSHAHVSRSACDRVAGWSDTPKAAPEACDSASVLKRVFVGEGDREFPGGGGMESHGGGRSLDIWLRRAHGVAAEVGQRRDEPECGGTVAEDGVECVETPEDFVLFGTGQPGVVEAMLLWVEGRVVLVDDDGWVSG